MISIVIVFVFGILIGSFLNVCIYRIPRGESIVYPPSHCTNCENKIKLYDLIPIISYVILRGKCRHCKEKISMRYPIIETATGLLFVAIFRVYGLSFGFIKYAIFISLLIVIAIVDYYTTDVYFSTILIGIIFSIVFMVIYVYLGIPIKTYIYGGFLGGGILLLINLITKGGMALGDVQVCFVCGLFLGIKLTVIMLALSFMIGGLSGICLILLGRKSRKDYIAFGPYIAAASIICIICGEKILNFYMSLMF